MSIRLDSSILGQLHQIPTHYLTVRQGWIVLLAFLRHFKVFIVNVESINLHQLIIYISRCQLGAFDILQESSSPVDSNHKRAADVARPITVFPAIDLRLCHQIGQSHISLRYLNCDVSHFEILSAQSHVECFGHNSLNGVLIQSLKQTENNHNEVLIQEGREIAFGEVDPTEQEVVISVRVPFHLLKELSSFSHIEVSPRFFGKWKNSNIESCILCPFLPLRPFISLNSVLRPVPSILTFHNIQLSIHFQQDSRVTSMRTSSILNNLINTIEPSDSQEISRLNLIVIQISKYIWSVFPSETCSSLNELNVQFLHVSGGSGPEEWNFRVCTQPSQEYFHSLKEIREPVFDFIAKSEDMDTPGEHIVNLYVIQILPGECMVVFQFESCNVEVSPRTQNISFSAVRRQPV